MPSKGPKNNLAGNYSISDVLKKELLKEFERDDSTSNKTLQEDINKSDYNRQRFQRNVDLNLDEKKSYQKVMQDRALELDEAKINRDIAEKENNVDTTRKRKLSAIQDSKGDDTGELVPSSSSVLAKSSTLENVPIVEGVPLTDAILEKILPQGFIQLKPPHDFQQDAQATHDMISIRNDYYVPPVNQSNNIPASLVPAELAGFEGLEHVKEEDVKHFGHLLKLKEEDLEEDKRKEFQSMKLILKVKNGSQITRKRAMRSLTENAVKFGPQLLLNQILPVLLEPMIGEQERHLLVKLVGRIINQLNVSIGPYTQDVIHVLSPFLIDEDSTIRNETRNILTSLTKVVGFATMISTVRPDLDHVDEYMRNLTSRVLAIVANTLGLAQFMPFLKAVVKSRKTWTAKHTGIKAIQQLCILLGKGNGSPILPHLSLIVETLAPAISDEVPQVRRIAAATFSSLAETVEPYGIDAFEPVLERLWNETRKQRGKGLAAFLKCIGSLIPLMNFDPRYEEYTNFYTAELAFLVSQHFATPEEEMRKTILKIISSLPLSKGIIPEYEKKLVKPFFKAFWTRRTASDNAQVTKLVITATNQLASQFDYIAILGYVTHFAKDENEQLRRLAVEALYTIVAKNPDELIEVSLRQVESLIDGVLFAFQEQTVQSHVYLQAFSTVAKALGVRMEPHLNSIISSVLYRMKNKSPEVRQQSSDLIAAIAPVVKICFQHDDTLLERLTLILYESLGEVYPDVLGSIINALYSCVNSIDTNTLLEMNNPSINQILPTLTPILKNRHEKVQESSIRLIGLIATKNAETINAKEWMRICFDLLEMLKSNKKRIRIAANATFGHISKTIGPQDIIVMLLNNLKVQERQLRVCTAVAMGIVAENCQPFTVLPAIMNEYKTPEKNIQNGVLKALSFLFEYLDGNTTKDYVFAITPLLEDALLDRDLVHRQIAATVVSHIALNCFGSNFGSDYDEVFVHLLNLIMPNVYETSPHVISRILDSVDALRLVLGLGIFMNYVWAGLFHPARKVRAPFWKIYNSAYIQCNDAVVPYYPSVQNVSEEDSARFAIEALDLRL
ncbi:prp10 [Candida margitis]|uniref:prp10 n=1 Tax=Candida margitis TaxID=1775924 RepID=UPI002227FEE2|nr:prp10 [Candida margitis]KAI5970250.1 prp10 [Candida margitis]